MPTRLKSLELQGYKTFASKTLFEFPGDITAIVGPNGAGKSNVSDAIRWVLGEQAYSLLRGRRTEDMIFAGSEHRPRASMATATIQFNNEDNWLPIDFSEVAITRRAYRDGQNEYLLNSQKVRLKETSELLARSGLAERTYTIIGQGLVDAALSLKPEDRRQFFEEAAGIGLYRSRREESIRRLETTKRNLERVQDILSEISPRLKSLERQALRAKEYSRVKADLDVLLRDWYGYHWHKAQNSLGQAKEKHHIQRQRLEEQRAKHNKTEKDLEESQNRIRQIREKLNQWHSDLSSIHSSREKVSRSIAILDERLSSFDNQKQNLESDRIRVEEEIKSKTHRLESISLEEKRLEDDLKSVEEQINETQVLFDKKSDERKSIENEYKNIQNQLITKENQKLKDNVRLNEISTRLVELKNSLSSIENNVSEIENQLDDNKKKIEDNRKKHESLKTKLDNKELNRIDLVTEEKKLEEDNKSINKELSTAESEIAKLTTQKELIEQAERTFSGINQGSKSILEASKSGHLTGDFTLLSQYLEVPEELDLAITAALGDSFNGLLINKNTEYEDALHLLSKNEKGRATFLIEEKVKNRSILQTPKTKGVIGIASDLIKSPDRYKNIFDSLLWNVLIVENRKIAKEIISSHEDIPLVVTLLGEIFKQNGIIIAGKDGKESTLKRNRTKKEINSLLIEFENIKSRIDIKLEKNQENIEITKEKKEKILDEINSLNHELNKIDKDFQALIINKEQLGNRKILLTENLKKQKDQIDVIETDIKKINANITVYNSEIKTLSKNLNEIQEKLIRTSLDEIKDDIASLKTNCAVIKRAVNDIKSRKSDLNNSIDSDKKQKENIIQRINDGELLLQQINNEKKENKTKEINLSQEIKMMQDKIKPLNEELHLLEKNLLALQEKQKSSQQTLNLIERHYTQAQLDVTYQRDSLEDLRKKIQDDLGLVDFKYSSQVSGPSPLPMKDLVEQLPVIKEVPEQIEADINRQKGIIRRLGPINPDIEDEYQEVKDRHAYLLTQTEDLTKADADLRQVIAELDEIMQNEFITTFNKVAAEFKQMFTILFGGGSAKLILNEADDPTKMGIDIQARLPGRREQDLSLLSGGERSLTAVALIFSLLRVSPTPFCVMDEVDAMLDEANVGRFCELLKELSQHTQFIVITHNRNTVQIADVIYGVTMGKDSASQIISLRIDEIGEDMVR